MKRLLVLLLLTGCTDKLATINANVNRTPYVEGKYDCRNFAEEKYKELIENGYNGDKIRFVITEYKGQPHVVLRVNGLILDNNYRNPYPATRDLQGGLDYHHWNYYRGI